MRLWEYQRRASNTLTKITRVSSRLIWNVALHKAHVAVLLYVTRLQ